MHAESDVTNRWLPIGWRSAIYHKSESETQDSLSISDEFSALNNSYELNRDKVLYQYSTY